MSDFPKYLINRFMSHFTPLTVRRSVQTIGKELDDLKSFSLKF